MIISFNSFILFRDQISDTKERVAEDLPATLAEGRRQGKVVEKQGCSQGKAFPFIIGIVLNKSYMLLTIFI
ncbi:MAG: hypothetical protein L3J12_04775 [Spirochaetales bacterium]|nr:hypothetical protein [Spirochaetales bacterium]